MSCRTVGALITATRRGTPCASAQAASCSMTTVAFVARNLSATKAYVCLRTTPRPVSISMNARSSQTSASTATARTATVRITVTVMLATSFRPIAKAASTLMNVAERRRHAPTDVSTCPVRTSADVLTVKTSSRMVTLVDLLTYATLTMVDAVCIINGLSFFSPRFTFLPFSIFTAHECDFVDNKISCSCRKGYKADNDDGKNCIDVNECRENNGG